MCKHSLQKRVCRAIPLAQHGNRTRGRSPQSQARMMVALVYSLSRQSLSWIAVSLLVDCKQHVSLHTSGKSHIQLSVPLSVR